MRGPTIPLHRQERVAETQSGAFRFQGVLPSGSPLICYELNEVPWRVWDRYADRNPGSAIAELLRRSRTYTTVTRDEGELHPWSTWPTVHRGVPNALHGLLFINQDKSCADAFPPIWERLLAAGVTVGVFGSLQSYPPIASPAVAFHVPDTFAPGDETWPSKYSAFQRFNLRQTSRDGAVAQPVSVDREVARDLIEMFRSGLRLGTVCELGMHLVRERLLPVARTRRSVFQAVVAFDVFLHALRTSQPRFSTFFTNHVAGMMHRYWMHAFPEDFGTALEDTRENRFHSSSIDFAMQIADRQLRVLMAYVDSRDGHLLVVSSMGQEAIRRDEYVGEWRLRNPAAFLRALDWSAPCSVNLAMQPDCNFSLCSVSDAEEFIRRANRLSDVGGRSIWKRARLSGCTVNLGLSPSSEALRTGFVVNLGVDGRPVSRGRCEEFGFGFIRRDPGTGYHQPRGIVLHSGFGVAACDSRDEIDSAAVADAVVALF